MRIPLLALFERSLRVDARTPSVFGTRAALLAILLISLFEVEQTSRYGFSSAPGLQLFQGVLWINVVFISLAGLSYFASAITEEKEEMMLGLLRMTDLNALSILLGKSTSRLVGAGMLLLAQVPFTLLAVTLGGVSIRQIAAGYCTLLAYVFLLCNIALFNSVVFRRTAVAALMTGVTVWILFVLPSAILSAFRDAIAAGVFVATSGWRAVFIRSLEFTTGVSAWSRLSAILRTGFAEGPVGFQVISNVVIGIGFFLLAWVAFEPCTRNQHEDAPARGIVMLRRRRSARVPEGVHDLGAVAWREFRFVGGGVRGLALKFLIFGAAAACFAKGFWLRQAGSPKEVLGGFLVISSLAVTAISLALDASRVFKSEVRWKTLSSLVLLPFSVREIAYRKVFASVPGVTPYLLYCLAGLTLIPKEFSQFLDGMASHPEGLMFLAISVSQYILFLHLTAYLSLVMKRGALPLAVAIQYVGGVFLVMPISLIFMRSPGGQDVEMLFILAGTLVVTGVLHGAIGARLARAAAEE